MTQAQHEATRRRRQAESEWLESYGWRASTTGLYGFDQKRWSHPHAPKARPTYSQKDAILMTDAEPLRYGGPR